MKTWLGNFICLIVAELLLGIMWVAGVFTFARGTKDVSPPVVGITVMICVVLILVIWAVNAFMYFAKYNGVAQYKDSRFNSQLTVNVAILVVALIMMIILAVIVSVGMLDATMASVKVRLIPSRLYILLGITFAFMSLEFFFQACAITCECRKGWIWETLGRND